MFVALPFRPDTYGGGRSVRSVRAGAVAIAQGGRELMIHEKSSGWPDRRVAAGCIKIIPAKPRRIESTFEAGPHPVDRFKPESGLGRLSLRGARVRDLIGGV